jgi:thioredoxin 1
LTATPGENTRDESTEEESTNEEPDYLALHRKALEAKKPILVYYSTPTCPPCKKIKPIINEIEKEMEGKVEVIRYNLADNRYSSLAREKGVRGVPTLHFIDSQGNMVKELVGFREKPEIMEELNKIIK